MLTNPTRELGTMQVERCNEDGNPVIQLLKHPRTQVSSRSVRMNGFIVGTLMTMAGSNADAMTKCTRLRTVGLWNTREHRVSRTTYTKTSTREQDKQQFSFTPSLLGEPINSETKLIERVMGWAQSGSWSHDSRHE